MLVYRDVDNKVKHFHMILKDIYRLQNNRTVLIGEIHGHNHLIKACNCEVVVKGQVKSQIWVEGEMLFTNAIKKKWRVISTKDNVDITQSSLQEGECLIYCSVAEQ